LEDSKSSRVLVVAHRACWRNAPENTLKAIKLCIKAGVDMVEIDVRKTKDGELVVIHDETLDRTTNGSGLVSRHTLEEIQTLKTRFGIGGANAALTDEKVPSLAELFNFIDGKILVNIDAKEEIRDEVFILAKQLGVENQTLLKNMINPEDTGRVKNQLFFGQTFYMPIVYQKDGELLSKIEALKVVDPIAYEIIYQTEEKLAESCALIAELNSRCWVNTMWAQLSPGHFDELAVRDPEKHWGKLIDLGVNMIQTDYPEELIEFLKDSMNR
jgi:glycerophosphoryl diester phosphodiesterase